MSTLDTLGRPLRSLRLSVTDRCNLRCHYCMPEDEYVWLPREDVLSFEETVQLTDLFGQMGVDRVRLTGGEPLLRRDLPSLVAQLAAKPWLVDLALTTNGVLLADAAADLKAAGLHRVTVSLDTMRPERFNALTRRDALPQVLAGIDAARRVGFSDLKIDSVITQGDNDDEVGDLLEYGRSVGAEVRFIEYMDVGGATHWRPDAVFSRAQTAGTARVDLRTDRATAQPGVSACGSLPTARRPGVRHHRVHHAAVLPDVRPRAPHRRRRVAAVSCTRNTARTCAAPCAPAHRPRRCSTC